MDQRGADRLHPCVAHKLGWTCWIRRRERALSKLGISQQVHISGCLPSYSILLLFTSSIAFSGISAFQSLASSHSLTHSPTIVQYAFRLHCHWSSCSSSQRLDLPRLRMLFLRACWIMTDFLRNLTIATATCSTLDSMKTRPQLSALRSWLLPSRMPQLSQQTSTTVM